MYTPLEVVDLRFEHHPTGLGIPFAKPRLSWRYHASRHLPSNWIQTSYEVEIKRQGHVKSFEVEGDSSVLNRWPDEPLVSREVARVRVRAIGNSHHEVGSSNRHRVATGWSSWKSVEAAFLKQDDWDAKFIGAPKEKGDKDACEADDPRRPIRLRKTFKGPKASGRARLYVSSLGVYVAYINGKRVGDEHLAPGWTSYEHRLQFQVFDVSKLLSKGDNTVAIEVAEGWYAGRWLYCEGGGAPRCPYGTRMAALAQLEIYSPDVDEAEPALRVVSDETWEYRNSPILSSGIYNGETYDLRLEEESWNLLPQALSSPKWAPVDIIPFPKTYLFASPSAPVRVTERVLPVKTFQSPSGKTLVDFGQNLVGKLHIASLNGLPEGHRLQFRHAEVLDGGELGTRPLRGAKQTDVVVIGASGSLVDWSPQFTTHGFRYVEIEGWTPPDLTTLSALALHADMERTGFFECSNDLVNQLHSNIVWSTRGNFGAVPTDCPQRDERLGWTGDIQVFCPVATFLFDCAGMLGNWMEDLLIDQRDLGGHVPLIVPNAMMHNIWPPVPQAIWGDVVVILPWTLYTWFGDAEILRRAYPGMKDHLHRSITRNDEGLWDEGRWQLGDWLDPAAPADDPGLARTDGTLVADQYLVRITALMIDVARALGLAHDVARFTAEHGRVRRAFADKYLAPSGLVVGDSQTSLALALAFGLHAADRPAQRRAAADRLARLVRAAHFRVATGFAGTPEVLGALSATGHTQLAYRMLLERGCPSWLYQVTMGATTTWERWDSMLPDGSLNPGLMTSFNHYALGSVAAWMHATIGGVAPLEPGWRRFLVRPRPGGDITSATVAFLSPSGWVRCKWAIERGRFKLELTVPPNAVAKLVLPTGDALGDEEESKSELVGSGEHRFECGFAPAGPWPP